MQEKSQGWHDAFAIHAIMEGGWQVSVHDTHTHAGRERARKCMGQVGQLVCRDQAISMCVCVCVCVCVSQAHWVGPGRRCLVSHSPNPQLCAMEGGVWDDSTKDWGGPR